MNCKLIFLLIAVFSAISAESANTVETCKTPDGKDGKCVPLNQCPLVYDGTSSRNATVLNYTKRSLCGNNEETLVCCEHPGSITPVDLEKGVLPNTSVCGKVLDERRIFGGKLTHLGEFPWMVGIYYKNRRSGEGYNSLLCGGSLINEEFVLTAAHCVVNREYEIDSVRLGEWDTTKDPDCVELVANTFCADRVKVVGVDEIIHHPLYTKKSGVHDISLIRLKEKVQFTDFIAPVCLSHPNLPPLALHTYLTTAGWGLTENDFFSNVLLKVNLPLVSREVCQDRYKRPLTSQLCVGGELGKDACLGDTGGPLMQIFEDNQKQQSHWYQYGITANRGGCAITGYPGIYTKVSDYIDWIVNVVSQY